MNVMKHTLPRLLLGLALLTPWAIAQAESPDWSLDAIIDTRASRAEGIRVLATTPGGAAEAIGIMAGDRLLSINGMSLADAQRPQRTLDHALDTSGGKASIVLLREGERLTLSGALAPWVTAADPGCGHVSDIDNTPNLSQDIHPALITQIDGRSTPLTPTNRHRVDAGQRVLVVSEQIPSHLFTRNQLRERAQMQRRTLARAYKALVVEVEPDTRYSIGARLIRSNLDSAGIRNNTYWEPVVHQTRAESCR